VVRQVFSTASRNPGGPSPGGPKSDVLSDGRYQQTQDSLRKPLQRLPLNVGHLVSGPTNLAFVIVGFLDSAKHKRAVLGRNLEMVMRLDHEKIHDWSVDVSPWLFTICLSVSIIESSLNHLQSPDVTMWLCK
jgi:hypothetical protein